MFPYIIAFLVIIHSISSIWNFDDKANEKLLKNAEIEKLRQHHEKCVMLGIIAIAILMK